MGTCRFLQKPVSPIRFFPFGGELAFFYGVGLYNLDVEWAAHRGLHCPSFAGGFPIQLEWRCLSLGLWRGWEKELQHSEV